MTMIWIPKHPLCDRDMLGHLPDMWSDEDPRCAVEQADMNYAHGGGWSPFKGFTMSADGSSLSYPGDPDMILLAETHLRDETIRFYQSSWIAIIQPDGSYEICRMD